MKLRRLCKIQQDKAMILYWVMFLFFQLPMGQTATSEPGNEVFLEVAFQKIGQEYDVFFSYDRTLVASVKVMYESEKYENVDDALSHVFGQTELKFRIFDQRYVAVYRDTEAGVESLKKMIDHFQGIVDNKRNEESKEIHKTSPLPALQPNHLKTIEQKRLVFNVNGRITDQEGNPLVGVNVLVKETTHGTATDLEGRFVLEDIDENAVLVISYIGYQTQEVPVAGRTELSITLISDSQLLNEVVVISYGTNTKAEVTGSISTVDASKVKDVPSTLLGQKLQGKAAGLQINQYSGRPGEGMQYRIRGAASFSGGFQPLIVVDGQPIVGSNSATGGISFLDPNDIENISVLKDASATALYGSRASNGVILITTKKAREGQTDISLNIYTAVQNVPERGRPNIMNGTEFATFMKGFYEDKIKYEGRTDPVPSEYVNPQQYGKGTDWYDAILRTAPQQSYSLSLTSGTERFSSSNTLTFMDQKGVLINSDFRRYSLRSNNEYRPNDYLKFGINLAPSYQIRHNAGGGLEGSRQVIGTAAIASPLVPIYDSEGNFNSNISSPGMLGVANPVQQLMVRDENNNQFRMLANVYGEVEFLPNLIFRSSLNADVGSQNLNYFRGTNYFSGFNPNLPKSPASNAAGNISDNYFSWMNENTLTYDLQLDNHSLKFLAGYSAQKWERNFRTVNGNNFPGDQVIWISGATTTRGNTNNEAWSMASAFGRLMYNFDQKYFFTGSIRRDGSSRFGADNKYGNFPAFSAGWILSNESFFPDKDWLPFVKLRASWGKTGNFNIGNYQQISNITGTNYVYGGTVTPGLSISTLGNRDLTWEVTDQTDIGFDVSFFNYRLSLSYDYYTKLTSGMLFATALPYSSGFTQIQSNVGELKIWGHEFQISSQNLTGELYWTTDFNISFNKNIIEELPPNTPFIGNNGRYGQNNRSEAGQPIAQFYGYIFEGIYTSQADVENSPIAETEGSTIGTSKMRDVNGDGRITPDDRTLIGDPNPDFIFGITNSLSYKNFDFNMIISGQYGNEVINMLDEDLFNIDGVFNMHADMLNVWRSPENPGNGQVPRTLSGTTEFYRIPHTGWIEDGSFLSFKNVTLGYTLDLAQLAFVKSARLYAGVQNLLTLTKFSGQNPEASLARDNSITSYGQIRSAYPIPRTFTIGLNINF